MNMTCSETDRGKNLLQTLCFSRFIKLLMSNVHFPSLIYVHVLDHLSIPIHINIQVNVHEYINFHVHVHAHAHDHIHIHVH
jgi:hypothetical protein